MTNENDAQVRGSQHCYGEQSSLDFDLNGTLVQMRSQQYVNDILFLKNRAIRRANE